MLILSRKNQEAVVISGIGEYEHLLKVTVLDVHGVKVRLGFEASNEILIHREEVWERITLEHQKAFTPPPTTI